MKQISFCLSFVVVSLVSVACSSLTVGVEWEPTPTSTHVAPIDDRINTIPSTDAAATSQASSSMATSTPTTALITTHPTDPPTDSYEGWIPLDCGHFTVKYPPLYYATTSSDPVYIITDTETTYDSWIGSSTSEIDDDKLMIQFIALILDRRLDPYDAQTLLATPEQALQREINRHAGIPYLVSGSTDVPWENANGGTDDGRKWFEPTVTYQNVMLGTTDAAMVIGDDRIGYFILDPNDYSYYVRIDVLPVSSILLEVSDQILSTFSFTN